MRKKIFRFMCLTALPAVLLISLLVMPVYHRELESRIMSEIRREAGYIKYAIDISGQDYLHKMQITDKRISLISPKGEVLFDNIAEPSTMDNHLDRAEVDSALKFGSGEAVRTSDTLSKKTYYYALRLAEDNVLRVAYTGESLFASFSNIIPQLVLVAIFTALLSIIVARYLTGRIVSPINSIDLEHPENNEIYDELAPLLSKIHKQNMQIKQHIDALIEKHREFSAITENMSEGFIVIDRNTVILSHNNSALKHLNATISSEMKSVYALNRSESFRNAVETALGGVRSEELLHMGSLCYQVIANPVFNDEKIAGAVILILDITEKEARETLRREFSANVSHELKTPLTSILGYSEIISSGLAKPEDVQQFAKKIHEEAKRLIALVNDIIRLSRLDEDSFDPDMSEVDLYEVSDAVIRQFSQSAEEKNIRTELLGKKTEILADKTIVEEIVSNLYINAVKYNRDGGKIIITVFDDNTGKGMSIADTGIGISYDQQKRVFERFYRVDKSHSKEIEGTGLGLSIVKHGAAFLGAKVLLESIPGKGTTVTIRWDT